MRFARNIILVENNSFRSSQLTRSGGTLAVMPEEIVKTKHMKKFLFLLLLVISCNNTNVKKEHIAIVKEKITTKKELKKFYDSDKIEHFYLDISEENVDKMLRKRNRNEDQNNLIGLLCSFYPKTISEPNFEANLVKYKFVKTELKEKKRKEVEDIFTQKDSAQTEFSSCVPYYRDVFIFKKNDSIVGIAKVCFGCGVSRFLGSKVDTEGFGLPSELEKLKKVIRGK